MALSESTRPLMWMLTKRRLAKPHTPQDQAERADNRNQDNNKLIELIANRELAGGRITVCRNIFDAIIKSVIELIQLFIRRGLITISKPLSTSMHVLCLEIHSWMSTFPILPI